MKKLLSLLLAAALLLPMAACGSEDTPADTTAATTVEEKTEAPTEAATEADTDATTDTEADTEAETEVETEEDRSSLCDLPEDLHFGEQEVGVLYVDGRESEWLSHEKGNGVVADAVYERNLALETRLGVKLAFHRVGDATATAGALKSIVDAGDTTSEIFSLNADVCMTPVTQGAYLDLNRVSHVDLSKDYWCGGYNDMMTLAGCQFVVSSPAAITLLQLQYSTLFNRTLFAQRGLTDLYTVVDKGEWSLDYQLTLGQDVYEDTDGNGKESKYDFYGFVTGANISLDGYCVGADVPLIRHNQDGLLYYCGVEIVDSLVTLNEKVSALYNVHGTYVCGNNNYIMSKFAFDECLMTTALFTYVESCIYMLDDISFGMAPLPKLTKEQTAYRTYVEGANTTFGISAAVTDAARRDMLGAVMEATAYFSNELVRPAYYESALPASFLQDARSRKALDDLYENIAFDYCFVENIGEVRNTLRGILSDSGVHVGSYQKRWEKNVKSELAKYQRNLNTAQ